MNKSNQKSQATKVIMNIVLVIVACALAIPLFANAQAPVIELTEDGKVPGQPFQVLQQQIDTMKQQVTDHSHDASATIETGYYTIPGPMTGGDRYGYAEGTWTYRDNIQLPHGATVVKLSLQVWDNDTKDASITLGWRNNPEKFQYFHLETGAEQSPDGTMASIVTSGTSASWQTLETTAISNPVIDNENNIYDIFVKWPSWEYWGDPDYPDVKGAKVVIKYILP